MKTKALSFTLIAAGFLLAGVPQSYADQKIYAASECKKWNEADPALWLTGSRIFNPSTQPIAIDCPVVKDRNANIFNSWIRVIDQHPGDQVCARLVALRHLGNSVVVRQGAGRCSGVALNSPNAVQLNTGGLTSVPWDAHYYFSVYRFPARYAGRNSGVVTYYVFEYNGAD
jgi:hypothetical protein